MKESKDIRNFPLTGTNQDNRRYTSTGHIFRGVQTVQCPVIVYELMALRKANAGEH